MKYYVGLDVSMKNTSVCIVDETGKIIHESTVKTDPHHLSVLTMRRCMVNQRTDIKNHVRGILKTLKTYGVRLGSVSPTKFSQTVKSHLEGIDRLVRASIEGLLEIFDLLSQKIETVNRELLTLSSRDKEVRLLMTIPGIGPITALTYKAEIYDPTRFKTLIL